MGDSFDAESGQHHDLEEVGVEVLRQDNLVTEFMIPSVRLTLTAAEIKIQLLIYSTNVPVEMRNHPELCDLVYKDDERRVVLPDGHNLLSYEDSLCGENSMLQVVYPRGLSCPQPKQDLAGFGVSKKQSKTC